MTRFQTSFFFVVTISTDVFKSRSSSFFLRVSASKLVLKDPVCSINISVKTLFFSIVSSFILEFSGTITSASLQYMSDSKYFITARIKIGDFRVGVDGTYCMLLDWQVVSCSDNGHTTPTTPPTIMEEKKSVTDKGGESVYNLDVTATIESDRRNHRVNVVSFILLSTLHHSK